MKLIDLFDQSSRVIQSSESLLQEYDEFSKMYTIDNDEYFENRLIKMGYNSNDVSSIMVNKDLLLSLFLNKFEVIEIDDSDTRIEIDLEVESARKKYIDAVDNANEAIKAADEAKALMLSTRDIIEKENGINPNKWTNKNIRNLNKAIALYNELVDKANNAVDLVRISRRELASVRIKKSDCVTENIVETNNIVCETS